MKVVRNIINGVGLIILVGVMILVIDYIRLNISYQMNKGEYVEGFPVYGNKGNYVPQGLAYSSLYNVVLQTSYNSNHTVSMLYVIDFDKKELIKEIKLKDNDGNDNTYHVGGIATDNNRVWITNDYLVYEYSLEEIINTESDYIESTKTAQLPIRGDFCAYHDDILWIGDFYLKPFYDVPDGNPLLLSYIPLDDINYDQPGLAISLPKMVQGLTFDENNNFVFTASFTYLIQSNYMVYDNVLNYKNDGTIKIKDIEIPHYKFSDKYLIKSIKMPPMAEGLFYKDGYYYILFESSTDSYPLALPRIKNVIKYQQKKEH